MINTIHTSFPSFKLHRIETNNIKTKTMKTMKANIINEN